MQVNLESNPGAEHAQRVDAQGNPIAKPEGSESRPEWLPENFKTPEDMAKSYSEAQAELTRLKQEAAKAEGKEQTPSEDPEQKPEDKTPENQEKVKQELEAKGVDVDAMSSRFAETGEVSKEDREELKKAAPWITDELITSFAEGQKALASTRATEMLSEVGGMEGFSKMSEWAKANMDPAKLEAVNKVLAGNDIEAAKLALSNVKAQMDAAEGADPLRKLGGDRNHSTGDVYESNAQLQADMRDPRYKADPAYREKVIAKLQRSSL